MALVTHKLWIMTETVVVFTFPVQEVEMYRSTLEIDARAANDRPQRSKASSILK